MNEEENVHISDGDDRLEEEKSPCDLLDEFTRIYEDSIKFIDKNIGNKCPELKLKTYKKWVCDLTEQNRELVKSVEELETVVTARLNLLESKLEEEKYNLHDRKMFRLESDLHNLVRFLRRISQENSWSTEGLTFQEIDLEKILSDIREEKEIDDEAGIIVEMTPNTSRIFTDGLENISKEMLNIRDDIKNSAIVHNAEESYKIFEENAMLREELASSKRSIQELVEKNRELEKAASDTQVLVEEIAKKHDKIQKMRSENGLLEESIRQANAQIKFKEDVIKELRRDISNLKKTFSPSERDSLDSSISDLSRDIQAKKSEIQEMGEKQKQDQRCLEKIAEELNQLKVDLGLKIPEVEEENSSNFVPEIEMLNAMKHEFFNLKHTISVLTVENGDFRKQIQGFKTQSSSVAEKLKELKDVQQVVFEIQSSIKSFDNDNNPDEIAEDKGSVEDVLVNFREQLERVRRENAEKSDELTKKETEIKTLMEQLEKQKVEMENMTEKKEFLETERIKNDQVIQDLKNAIKTHTDTENELKMASEDLQKRLKDMESGHQTNEIFTKLLADKNRLEVERSNDIESLMELVENLFDENCKLEKHIVLLQDENLQIRVEMHEALVDYAELKEKWKPTSRRFLKNRESSSGKSDDDSGVKSDSLFVKEHSSEMETEGGLSQNKEPYTQIIYDLSNELQSLTEQLLQQPQQQELIEESLQLKNLMEDLELQNDTLQQTIESYMEQMTAADTKVQNLEFDKSTLERELAQARTELSRKDAKIEEVMRENRHVQTQLDIVRRFCTCRTSSMLVGNDNGIHSSADNMDKNTQCIQELQKLLNQKSSEASKATVALRWKSLEWSRVQQMATEEKKKLTQQMKELINNVGELKKRIATMETVLEKKDKELEKANQKLATAAQRENEFLTEISSKDDQLNLFKKDENKFRETIEDLSQELEVRRSAHRRRESVIIQELNAASGDTIELEKQNSSLQRENSILKNEMEALKDEVATLEGKSKALSDILKVNQVEMDQLKQEINRLLALDAEMAGVREDKAIFEKHNQDLLKRYQSLQKDYEELQNEYKLLLEIKAQTEIILENMKMWEDEHEEREKIIQKKISKQSEHINTLLDDRKMLITKINTMHQDIVVLSNERQKYEERFKELLSGPSFYLPNSQDNMSLPTKLMRYNSDPQLNDPQNVFKKMKHTSKRLNKAKRLWEEHMREVFH